MVGSAQNFDTLGVQSPHAYNTASLTSAFFRRIFSENWVLGNIRMNTAAHKSLRHKLSVVRTMLVSIQDVISQPMARYPDFDLLQCTSRASTFYGISCDPS